MHENVSQEIIGELKGKLEEALIVIETAVERANDELEAYEYDIAQNKDDEMTALAAWRERAMKVLIEGNKLV